MDCLTNEFLFYGGIGLVVFSLTAGLIFLGVMLLARTRLKSQLYMEYGEAVGDNGKKRKKK